MCSSSFTIRHQWERPRGDPIEGSPGNVRWGQGPPLSWRKSKQREWKRNHPGKIYCGITGICGGQAIFVDLMSHPHQENKSSTNYEIY